MADGSAAAEHKAPPSTEVGTRRMSARVRAAVPAPASPDAGEGAAGGRGAGGRGA
ncbi:hypothetical protein GCM10027168_00350 [Streptomyces capparidis]